jgi:hypothetical protein
MSDPVHRFNPNEAVTFDLAYGHVHLDGAPSRVLVPAGALAALCQAAGEDDTANLGFAMGDAMGKRAATRVSADANDRQAAVRAASLERVMDELAGELALAGLGALSAERWGRALVLVVDRSPLGEEGDVLLAEVLRAALKAAAGRDNRVLPVGHEGERARFLVVSAAAVEGVKRRLREGAGWAQVVAALQHGGPTA